MTCPLVGCILQSIQYDIQSQPNGPFSAFKSAFADLFLYSSPRWVRLSQALSWFQPAPHHRPISTRLTMRRDIIKQFDRKLPAYQRVLRTNYILARRVPKNRMPPGLPAVWPLDLLRSMYTCRVSNTLHKLTDVPFVSCKATTTSLLHHS